MKTNKCPIPTDKYPTITMAYGGGGKLMHRLLEEMIVPAFKNERLELLHDGAVFSTKSPKLAFSTDSYVINPIFFPGGDIGSLAIHGTVNDLAMCGAKPLYLSAGFIIEEGLAMETLWQIILSMKKAAEVTGIQIITGDTKVVDKGKGDGIFINTAGIGVIEHNLEISPKNIKAGDAIILSGDIGRHGIAIMAKREGLEFESTIESDSAPVSTIVQDLIANNINIHCMRDLTRGGLASALVEIADSAKLQIQIDETKIPVHEQVNGACEILGFDAIYVANEGRFIAIVDNQDAQKALQIMQKYDICAEANIIGNITEKTSGQVVMKSTIGVSRIVDMISGEQLPRIC